MVPILNQSLWRDEAFSALLSLKTPLQIILLSMKDATPPLHYLLLHYWMLLFGNTEVSMRGLSFILHLFTVLIIFFIVRRLTHSISVQILISFSVLLNPFLLQYAFEARAYSMLSFLITLAVYLAITKRYFLAGVALTLAVFTHNFAVFSLAAFIAWFLYHVRHRLKSATKEVLQFFLLPIISLFIWGNVIWTQWVQVAGGFWIKQATSSMLINSLEKYARGDLSYPTQPMLYTFSLILLFFAFSYWIWKDQKEEEGSSLLLIGFVILVPSLVTYFVSALFAPIYNERYLIFTAPMLIILVGYSLTRLYNVRGTLHNVIIAVVAIYTVLLLQSSEQIVAMSTKPAINYAVSQVLSKVQTGDVIIPQDVLNFLETKYYVEKSGKNISVFAYSPSGKVPFYIGGILFEPQEIVREMPKYQRVWRIKPDGGYELESPKYVKLK